MGDPTIHDLLAAARQDHVTSTNCPHCRAVKALDAIESQAADIAELRAQVEALQNRWASRPIDYPNGEALEVMNANLHYENDTLRAKLESLQRDLAARDATIAELRERVKDYEDDYAAVVDEPCAPDEKHCTCVPILRRRIKELTAAEAKRFDLACAWRDTAEHIKAERDALRAKLEAAEKDAARYRWLFGDADCGKTARVLGVYRMWNGQSDWDAAVDVAIAAVKAQEEGK